MVTPTHTLITLARSPIHRQTATLSTHPHTSDGCMDNHCTPLGYRSPTCDDVGSAYMHLLLPICPWLLALTWEAGETGCLGFCPLSTYSAQLLDVYFRTCFSSSPSARTLPRHYPLLPVSCLTHTASPSRHAVFSDSASLWS